MRVLGVDPGLTRCGIGVVEVAPDRRASLVHVSVVRTPADMALEMRLLHVAAGIAAALDEHRPDAVAVERVFAQANVRTVMGTAQAAGLALHAAATRAIPVALHTPSEVKAAITGYGNADKRQVGAMVARVLGLAEAPRPADAADALALAICHAWRGGPMATADRRAAPGGVVDLTAGGRASATGATPAQRAWREAERASASRAAAGPRAAGVARP